MDKDKELVWKKLSTPPLVINPNKLMQFTADGLTLVSHGQRYTLSTAWNIGTATLET